jgi:hypothetical protein
MTHSHTSLRALAELRKLALGATPGPWTATTAEWHCDWKNCECKNKGQDECLDGYWDGCPGVDKIYTLEMGDFFAMSNEDAAYVAAVDPQTVLGLLDEVERLREALGSITRIIQADEKMITALGDPEHCSRDEVEMSRILLEVLCSSRKAMEREDD